jgi:hypothetical protein
MEFGDKFRAADARHLQTGDDEAEISSKMGLFNETKCLGCIADALDILKSPLQNGLTRERLEGVIVHQ